MKQFCKKISLLLIMVAAGTSIAMQEGPLQVETLVEALEALKKLPQSKKLSKDVEKKIQNIVAYINEAYVDKFIKSEQEKPQGKPLERLLPSKTWGVLPRDIQLVIANQLIEGAVYYIKQLGIPRTIKAHTSRINSVGFNHDGSRLVSGASDGKIKIWNVDNGQWIHALLHGKSVNSVGFNHDGSRLVSGGDDGMVKMWNADNGQWIYTFSHGRSVNSVGFSPDGIRLVSGSDDGTIKIWDVDSGQPIRTFSHGSFVYSVGFNHDGSRIVSGARNGSVKIWDVDNVQLIHTFHHGGWVNSVGFNPDGSMVVSGADADDESVKIWDVDSGQPIRTFSHGSFVYSVGFNHDGSRIVSGADADDESVKIWNVDSGQPIRTFSHGSWVNSVGFNHDGSRIVSGARDGTIKIWDLQGKRKQKVFDWFAFNDFNVEHAVIINYAYEAKLRGEKLALKGDGLLWFNTMPDYVRSLLIDYLDISILR